MKEADARGFEYDRDEGLANTALLTGEHEQAVLKSVTRYRRRWSSLQRTARPHALAHYLRELANTFHTYYNAEQFIVPTEAAQRA